mmetsp:Transcript_17339/g.45256  ORF Transcript_17339/g.45256 Transcript_17339/m.45256 type:complete len:440 (+) Transcript_17339:482-1801(+)
MDEGLLAAKPAAHASEGLSFIDDLDKSLWDVVIAVFDVGVYVVMHVPVIFRASGIIILFIFCWGLNVYGMDQAGVPFRTVLGLKQSDAKGDQVFSLSGTLLAILVVFLAVSRACHTMDMKGAEAAVSTMYGLMLVGYGLLSDAPVVKDARVFLHHRAMTFLTMSEVKFIDVLFADALTSSSKVLADMSTIVCACIGYLLGDMIGITCSNSYLGPALASLPYCIRAVQCWNTYSMKNDQWQLVNFGKYLSSLPVIWLSAFKAGTSNETPAPGQQELAVDLEVLWLYSVVINTVYSFLWDVFKDWGLGLPRSSVGKPQWLFLRPVLAYNLPLYYYLMIVVDLALRGCWSLKLSSHLQRYGSQGQVFILIFEVLEVLRRWAWIYFRVEWECIAKKVPFLESTLPRAGPRDDSGTPSKQPSREPSRTSSRNGVGRGSDKLLPS